MYKMEHSEIQYRLAALRLTLEFKIFIPLVHMSGATPLIQQGCQPRGLSSDKPPGPLLLILDFLDHISLSHLYLNQHATTNAVPCILLKAGPNFGKNCMVCMASSCPKYKSHGSNSNMIRHLNQ